jgi:hypothetical protein
MREAWPVTRSWDAAAEADYSAFVHAIGRAVARGRCHTLSACLNVPGIDPLAEPVRSARFLFHADCADVPYLLRAWFAYRRGLPFAFAARMLGSGVDERYLRGAHADGQVLWTAYPTPRSLFEWIGHTVHSGYFRTAPPLDNGDFYQAAVAPGSIRPGTMFYDPNGHVLVVYDVRRNGMVLLFDGHVGGRLTNHGPLDMRAHTGSAAFGGGFKNFRPLVERDGALVRLPNADLPDFGGDTQFTETGAGRQGFAEWTRARLRLPTHTPHRGTQRAVARRTPRTGHGAG